MNILKIKMKGFKKIIPKEKNTQNKDIFYTYRSNSQNHYRDISNYNYEHRIRLNPLGEHKTLEARYHFPISHVHDAYIKSDYLHNKNRSVENAYDSAELQSKITSHIKKQKYQTLLENEKDIKKLCKEKSNEIKKEVEKKKIKLKESLTRIIKDAIKFSKKNNPIRSMLPENINEIVENVKKETQDLSLNLSHISRISRISSIGGKSGFKKNQLLNLLGVDVENINSNNVNVDIDKCWNFVVKLAKGRKVEEILRFKVVNEIMAITEKQSAEKAKKIYEKLDIYKKYRARKKNNEMIRKKMENEKKETSLKMNTKEFIKLKIQQSLSQPKKFSQQLNSDKKNYKTDRVIKKRSINKDKKLTRCQSVIIPEKITRRVIRLDAYNDVNKIIDFIDNSKRNSQSKLCRKHFANIQINKGFNTTLHKMIDKNSIIYK